MKAALFGSDGLRDNTGPLVELPNEVCGRQDITRALSPKEKEPPRHIPKDHKAEKMIAT
jgi:hypothetical protein